MAVRVLEDSLKQLREKGVWPMDTRQQLDDWRGAALEGWTDHRIVDDAWVDVQIWFWLHLYADLAQYSLELDGANFSARGDVWLLVLKVHQGDTPLVGFVTSKNPTRCMSKARDLLRNGGLNWSRDKYR